MTDTDRMVAWLRETIGAAQRDAEAAGGDEWRRHEDPSDQVAIYDSKDEVVVYNEGWPTEEQQAHIVRHSPAAVLRRIAADRKMLDEHPVHLYKRLGPRCRTCGGRREDVPEELRPFFDDAGAPYPCDVVRLLAEGWGWTKEEQR